ncbi:sulfite exporter TauE/SafE family protein [Neisseria animalis]|uniref:Probable membrane transporter protein n=1 Tax=Neisseria animalis TaxID=492 RepID=A0A5P3MTB1_NEIAN|nr:sulfite exporter TauE/SafE family protein [Neisseria animalis]QEY24315.1 sulfite exporter TauE/SafE family protein [Neisseria animalis]ROW32282.1 sulfite exporter TauE/SafE family protein [Neisseria animalis]VEE06761.1 Sulfite exporter TauE/SafE [Neisseria animalis]
MWQWDIVPVMLAVGALSGLTAGLFGVGGGLVLVPAMLWIFQLQGWEGAHSQHVAIGTAFAVMVCTTLSGVWAQHKRQAVDWKTVGLMVPGMVCGTLAGSMVAKYLPNDVLQVFFIVFAVAMAVKVLADVKPKPSRSLPNKAALAGIGGVFGMVSSWVGIGGGSLSVPFLLYCNVPVHRAVGTSSGLAWPIALAGALGYLVAGWYVEGLPDGTLGFWYLPAVAILGATTVLFAPVGVKLAHRLPDKRLKQAFGCLLLFIALRMLWRMWTE